MATDEFQSSPDSLPLADLSRDVEFGTAGSQPESRIRRLKGLFNGQLVSLCGWVLALISTVVSIAALLPAFRGQQLSEKQLKLAEWTAFKDYLDQCMEAFNAGHVSKECKAALGLSLPPPPGFQNENINSPTPPISLSITLPGAKAGPGKSTIVLSANSVESVYPLVFMIVPLLYLAPKLARYVSRMKRKTQSGDYKSPPKTRQGQAVKPPGGLGKHQRNLPISMLLFEPERGTASRHISTAATDAWNSPRFQSQRQMLFNNHRTSDGWEKKTV